MTTHSEEDDQRQLKLTVEVSEDRVEQAMRQRARQLAREIRVPGFRRGKVPYGVVLQRFGRDLIRAEAVEEMVQEVYEEATEEIEVAAYGRPSLDDLQVEPLVLQFTIPLEPVITLGDYRALRKEIAEVTITDEAVEEALEQVRIENQQIESVDRASEVGDVLSIGGKGELIPLQPADTEDDEDDESSDQTVADSGGVLLDEESIDVLLDSEKLFPGTDFVDHLVGTSAGEQTSFTIIFPEDFEDEDLAGREAKFDLNVLDVKRRELPPVDDELAKMSGEFESLEELLENLKGRLQEEAEGQAKEELIESMVDDLLEDAELAYPPAAVEMEIDDTVDSFRDQVTRSGWDFDDYLKLQGQSEEELRENFRESSETRLRRRLAMRQFVVDEMLRIESTDIEALIDDRVGRYDNEELRNNMREFYLSGSGFDMISSEVLSEKVYDRARAILAGEAPDLEELAAELEAEAETSEEE